MKSCALLSVYSKNFLSPLLCFLFPSCIYNLFLSSDLKYLVSQLLQFYHVYSCFTSYSRDIIVPIHIVFFGAFIVCIKYSYFGAYHNIFCEISHIAPTLRMSCSCTICKRYIIEWATWKTARLGLQMWGRFRPSWLLKELISTSECINVFWFLKQQWLCSLILFL